jgi:hypothetical protein
MACQPPPNPSSGCLSAMTDYENCVAALTPSEVCAGDAANGHCQTLSDIVIDACR